MGIFNRQILLFYNKFMHNMYNLMCAGLVVATIGSDGDKIKSLVGLILPACKGKFGNPKRT